MFLFQFRCDLHLVQVKHMLVGYKFLFQFPIFFFSLYFSISQLESLTLSRQSLMNLYMN